MKTRSFLTLLLVGCTTLAALGAESKLKRADLSGFPFWSSPKRGFVPPFIPGLNATLQLTDAQAEQIAKAQSDMGNDESVKAARSLSKSDTSVTAEQREKARATMDAATARMREQIATILTPEQKTLIEKINAVYAAASEETGIVYADKFASIKADPEARKRIQEEKNQDMEEQFLSKLDGILNESQKAALAQAAEAEIQRNAKAAATKKTAK
ncbi:hypothetical protein DES53_10858 [Roseimicrobium gellanilyticum]|uniref:LTXXQ motif family protein n=1 Tax=Roseimicrobium gellanilyticum TaxID=748857 RepID=A0A366HD17_9BACT|nr:hypothetical protein [Roseimicrobium gellanilyticum]RBP40351.1 hypothetical protein DES53_10858 [Roseimicrobium gellanilyticum]